MNFSMLDFNEEWLLSNTNGSYSSSSVSFANLRTYHGLCVKSVGKNYDRFVLLSKLFEELIVNGKKYSLDTNYYKNAIYPNGYSYLMDYKTEFIPSFTFKIEDLKITKSIVMDPENDWIVIKYEFDGNLPSSFYLHPLLAFRNYHLALRERKFDIEIKNGGEFHSEDFYVKIKIEGKFVEDRNWFYNFQYPMDRDRGSNYEEDLYHPGYFEIENPGKTLEIKISCSEGIPESFNKIKKKMIKSRSYRGELKNVVKKSTLFITRDDIIAGFYWFGPWTRDTMISLPGILLVRKRYDLAKKILEKYSSMVQNGMLPASVSFNSPAIDTALWLIYALYKYYIYTFDRETIGNLYPDILNIIDSYIKGNDYVSLDGHLIKAKKPQLTWMDAKTGDVIFNPRVGLPVEVNALWYNALSTVDFFARELNFKSYANIENMIPLVKEEFRNRFVEGNSILDTVDPDDNSLRPNFILAFSLPYPVMDKFSNYSDPVNSKLLTKFGLRSLSPGDPKYVGKYQGDQYHRDMAYHNGSVWPWLIGPYITASVRDGTDKKDLVEKLKPLLSLKMIPEIFDGDEPHEPRGCIMQAWSYGEIIRAYHEDLSESGKNEKIQFNKE